MLGTLAEPLGITILAAALNWGHLPTIYGMLGLTGVGTGIRFMPGTLHGVGYYRRQIAPIVSLMSLAISLGGTLASTIMLNIFNNKMSDAGISFSGTASSASSFDAIAQLSPEQQAYLKKSARNSIVVAFYALSAFLWLGVVAMLFMGNVDIKKDANDSDMGADGETEVGVLTKGAYVGSCFRQRKPHGGEKA